MSTEQVKVGNAVIQVNDKRAVSNRSISNVKGSSVEHHAVLRVDENATAYSLMDRESRRLLAADLQHVARFTFDSIPHGRQNNWVYQQKDYLLEALGLLAKESNGTLIMRHSKIQRKLDKFFCLINKINVYSTMSQDYFAELFVSRAVKRYIKSLNALTNRSLTKSESVALAALGEVKDDFYFIIDTSTLQYAHIKRSLHDQQNASVQAVTAKSKTNEAEEKKEQEKWLANLSPDLFAAYRETEERIAEVSPLVTSPEDEYFIEQITNDYYPHIFESLRNLARTEADFSHKESVVLESIKQFKIIQLGLERIMDSAVAQNLSSIRSQTDFLMNKVLGENALTLTPEKQDEALDATLEEAQRIREELYKQHVAPVLEKNRQEYEEKLAELEEADRLARSEFEKQLFLKEESHKKAIAVLKRDQQAALLTVSAAKVREISGLKQEHEAAIRRLTNEHITAITELFRKYQALQQQIDNMEAPDFYVKATEAAKAKQLASDYREKLVTYQMQISSLNDQIHQLEALVVAVMDKSAPRNIPENSKEDKKTSVAQAIAHQPSQWHNGYNFKSSDDLLHDARAEEEDYKDYMDEAKWSDSEDYDYEPPVKKLSTPDWRSLLGDELLDQEVNDFLEDEEF